ncbi:amidase [Paenibacillus sp. LMG 31461]|uniref:Amidase n=1 Tax=Paenibacillus plantarum TaxID=2654975 RepID=A0ABX1XMP5_9BACL|nr:amidase family protein [Paenibacillus plantarum]NOU69731.1 amidase [Paenibacillus plantarum]
MARISDEWMTNADIVALQLAMERQEINSVDLVVYYTERIKTYNGKINAVLELNPDAIEIAESLDRERVSNGSRGPLHGIPILLKDNIQTADQMHTSAGSICLAEHVATEDAYIAAKLRDAGAVLLGKVNMTEWANFMAVAMPSGYSSRGGQVANPYGPGIYEVGGSSSGSGAAVATHFAVGAIGTETSGSIVNPAGHNSLVGLKPTVGLLSRSGIIPLASSQDTPGPMTRTVTDAAVLLGVMTGVDASDAHSIASDGHGHRDYTPYLNRRGLHQARIGIPRWYYQHLDEEERQLAERAIQVLRDEGAIVIDDVVLPCQDAVWNYDVLLYEFKRDLNAYLAKLDPSKTPVHSLEEVIAFNERHADQALVYGQDTLIWSEDANGTLTEETYLTSLHRYQELTRAQGIDHALHTYQLDALFFPKDEGEDIAARAGYPLLIVPAGYTSKGPMGVMFAAGAYSEPTLIKLAYAFEQATLYRRPPIL